MAGRLSKIGSAIGRLFGRRQKPKARLIVGEGHRGIAAGNLTERHRRMAAGEQPYSQAEIDKWQTLSGDIVEDFIYNEQILHVNSSNVANATYFSQERKMLVQFLNGGRYLYSNVSEQEALAFAQSQSKGDWVWSNLRVRGSKTAHRKPWTKL